MLSLLALNPILMGEIKNLTNYYKLFTKNGDWCIVSFEYENPVVADRIIKCFIRYNIHYARISKERFLEYNPTVFYVFRIGAIRFDVCSNCYISPSLFFYRRFVIGYVSCEKNSDGLHAHLKLPSSSKEENLRRVLEGMEDGVLPLQSLLELHP